MFLYLSLYALLGLAVGSFLNVVIHRFPLILKRQQDEAVAEFLEAEGVAVPAPLKETLNEAAITLSFPPSRCPSCKHKIGPLENVPVLSYLFLKGKCKACKAPISLRYPVIELLTGLLFVLVFLEFGFSYHTLAAGFFCAVLVSLAGIDYDLQILPDELTLCLLWAGLLVSAFSLFTDPVSAILGAVAGYGILWLLYHAFRLVTQKEGLGYGDFKLLAAIGAWLGWEMLPVITLIASISGIFYGLFLAVRKQERKPFAFGPFLGVGAIITLLYGPYLRDLIRL